MFDFKDLLYVAQAGLKLTTFLPQPAVLGLWARATSPSSNSIAFFHLKLIPENILVI